MYRLIFISLILIYSCETEEEVAAPLPQSCSNSILDYGELAIDCGPDCNPCGTIAAPCSLPQNTSFLYDKASVVTCLPEDTLMYTFRDTTNDGHFYNIRFWEGTNTSGMSGGPNLYIRGEWPTTDRIYILDNWMWGGSTAMPSDGYGHATLEYGYAFCGNVVAFNGTLYADVHTDGSITFTYCDAELKAYLSPSYYTIYLHAKGSFTVP